MNINRAQKSSKNSKRKISKVSNKFIRKFKGKNHKVTRGGLDEIINSKKSKPIVKEDAIKAYKRDLSEKLLLERRRASLSNTYDIYSKIKNEAQLFYLNKLEEHDRKRESGDVLELKEQGSGNRPKFLESNLGFYRRKITKRRSKKGQEKTGDIIDKILKRKKENPRNIGMPNIDGYIWDNFRYGHEVKDCKGSDRRGGSTGLGSDIYSCNALESSMYKNRINRMNEEFVNDVLSDINRLDSNIDRRNSFLRSSNSSLFNLYDEKNKALLKSSSFKRFKEKNKHLIGRKTSTNSSKTATSSHKSYKDSYLDRYFAEKSGSFYTKMEKGKADFTSPKLAQQELPSIYDKEALNKKKRRINTDRILGRSNVRKLYRLE